MQPMRFALLMFLCALPGVARADEPASTLRVFYTGHSFHMFVPGRIAEMARAAGVKDYELAGRQGLGGSRVQQHWDLPEAKNQARKVLEKAGADVFTMAPNVKMPDEGIDRFAELGLKHNPRIRLLVQESWVPGDYLGKRITSNAQRDETDLARLRADQEAWRGQMEAQAKAINQKAGRDAVSIVPAGDAVVKLRELVAAGKVPGIARQSELFTDVIGHGKAPIQMLTAYCNFTCITGRSPVGLKVAVKDLSEELNSLLQRIAWQSVTSYALSGVKAPVDAADSRVELKNGDRILFFGDSLTYLAGKEDPKKFVTKGYVRIVKETLDARHKDKNIAVDWVATGGHTVPDLLKRVDKDVIAKKPTIVVIQIGCNDARRIPAETFKSSLEELIGRLQKEGIQVVQCTLTSVGEKHDGTNKYDPKLEEFAAIERQVAQAMKVPLNDLRKAFVEHWKKHNPENKANGILTYDGNHFNDAGHQFVAEQMLKRFR